MWFLIPIALGLGAAIGAKVGAVGQAAKIATMSDDEREKWLAKTRSAADALKKARTPPPGMPNDAPTLK